GAFGKHSTFKLKSSTTAGVTGTRAISHLGQVPAVVVRISGCIGQVYSSSCLTTSRVRCVGAGAGLGDCFCSLLAAGLSGTSFIPHFGHLRCLDDCTSGCIGHV